LREGETMINYKFWYFCSSQCPIGKGCEYRKKYDDWEELEKVCPVKKQEATKKKFNEEYEKCLEQGKRYQETGNINEFRK